MGAVDLRPLTPEDAEAIAGWALDPEFCAVADWTPGLSLEESRRRQLDLVLSPPTGLLRLGAWHSDELVGYADLAGEGDRRELGFVVGPRERWGSGLGGLVARAGVRHGFKRLGLRALEAQALDANPASIRILQRLGMTEVGQGGRQTYRGGPTFHRRFELLASDPASLM